MPQIKFNDVCMQHGAQWLLDHASFAIDAKERIAIIGRNGAGKSTLLKLIEGLLEPDSGSIERSSGLHIASMVQEVPENLSGTLFDYIKQHHLAEHDWDVHQIDKVIADLGLEPGLLLEHASGGQLRRALLAAALVNEPDVLLLDEPTNHLDIDSILWLEKFLLRFQKTLIFITHDRDFMQHLATRIFEIDLGRLTNWQGDYAGFLKHKANALAAEARSQQNFEKKLSKEEVWIRQGIKARRTRNEGRVRALKKMREAYAQRRQRQGTLSLASRDAALSGKIVFELDDVHLAHGGHTLVKGLTLGILRGDKVAIIGANGCGKSSLIKVMLGMDEPTQGHIKRGTNINLVYFDQCREQLDLNASAIDNVAQGSMEITVNGRSQHVISYLQEFLFTPDKARSPVKTFSGGERNRLLLAKILAKPSNVLVLDEPTNDLDMETLDVLDEFLVNYHGTLIVISHDRALLNHVATRTLVFEGDGKWQDYVGGYDDYIRQSAASSVNQSSMAVEAVEAGSKTSNKLSHQERKELQKLPKLIEKTEAAITQCHERMADPDFYQQSEADRASVTDELAQLTAVLQGYYDRWEHLEQLG